MSKKTKVITGKVRLSYVHAFETFAFDDDDNPRYSVMLLVPKKDKKTVKALRDAEAAALENNLSKWGGKEPRDLNDSILKDGDDYADEYPERAGHLFMTVRSKTRPGVVDRDLDPIIDPSELYSGCYARVSVSAFAYATGKAKGGVSFGLNNIQKVADGEPLGGSSRAEDDFEPIEDDDDLI